MKTDKYINQTLGGKEWEPRFIVGINQKTCSQCCFCIKICPAGVFSKTVKGTVEALRTHLCHGCTCCERMCKQKSITCLPIDKHPKGKRND